jgi:predicted alpha/beta superfamily hydrolase
LAGNARSATVSDELVELTLEVVAPPTTPATATLYIAGNRPELGMWKPNAVPLRGLPGGSHVITLQIPRDFALEYKYTLGSWQAVERTRDGRDRPNRRLIARPGTVQDSVEAWAGTAPLTSTRTGNIQIHREFPSRFLIHKRDLWVYLPPGYADAPETRYPVLYLQDGQNLFDAATAAFGTEWQADETAERLIRAGRIRPCILVGIANTPARIEEYTATPDPGLKRGGKGVEYLKFVFEELKPFIDATYRTIPGREGVALGGSSLGGLIALEAALLHPDRVRAAAALSPSLWWDRERTLEHLVRDADQTADVALWVDMGDREGGDAGSTQAEAHIARLQRLKERLEARQHAGAAKNRVEVFPGAAHHEAAWAARFDQVLLFLFPKEHDPATRPEAQPQPPP